MIKSNKVNSALSFKQILAGGMLTGGLLLSSTVLANDPVSVETTTYTYDAYGNRTMVSTIVENADQSERYSKTITNSFDPADEAKWIFGRLTRSLTARVENDGSQLTRTKEYSYVGDTYLVASEVVEPDDPDQKITIDYTYDDFGNQLTATTSATGLATRSVATTWSVDGRYPLTETNNLGQTVSRTYDPLFGLIATETGLNGHSTNFTRDGLGRVTAQAFSDGTKKMYAYTLCVDPAQLDTRHACPVGAIERTEVGLYESASNVALAAPSATYLDKRGRVIQTQTQDNVGTSSYADTFYDAFGRVVQATRPYRSGETPISALSEYDVLDRIVKTTDAIGGITTTAYNGLTQIVTNALGKSTTHIKDLLGRTSQVTDPMGGTIDYDYDPFDNLEQTTDVNGNEITIAYDALGRRTSLDDPDLGFWEYEYNAYGELVSQTSPKLDSVTLTYDLLGRLASRVENEGTTTWTYDSATNGVGLLASVISTDGGTAQDGTAYGSYVESHSYDTLSRPLSTTRTIANDNYTTSLSYDVAGRLDTVTYPTGYAVSYTYTATGYLDEITETATSDSLWQAVQRDASGSIITADLGNGLTEITNRDALGRVVGRNLSDGVNSDILDIENNYDLVGNITSREDIFMQRHETFAYDDLNRLTSNTLIDTDPGATASNPLAVTSYGYDLIGNLTSKSDLSDNGVLTYDGLSKGPHAVSSANGNSYTYDASGNTLTDGTRSYQWSSYDKPTQITKSGTGTSDVTRFTYGPSRARILQSIEATVSGSTTITQVAYIGSIYESRKIIGADGTQTGIDEQIHYVQAGEVSLAIHKKVVQLDTTATSETLWVSKDHLGSTLLTTDINGMVSERLSYDPHGKRRETDWQAANLPIAPSDTPRGFTGHEHLDSVGIIHMNGRVYDPVIGRMLSADLFVTGPYFTQDYNRYSYVRNNPLSYTDPTGFRPVGEHNARSKSRDRGTNGGGRKPGEKYRDWKDRINKPTPRTVQDIQRMSTLNKQFDKHTPGLSHKEKFDAINRGMRAGGIGVATSGPTADNRAANVGIRALGLPSGYGVSGGAGMDYMAAQTALTTSTTATSGVMVYSPSTLPPGTFAAAVQQIKDAWYNTVDFLSDNVTVNVDARYGPTISIDIIGGYLAEEADAEPVSETDIADQIRDQVGGVHPDDWKEGTIDNKHIDRDFVNGINDIKSRTPKSLIGKVFEGVSDLLGSITGDIKDGPL